jgi:hypothetical protein
MLLLCSFLELSCTRDRMVLRVKVRIQMMKSLLLAGAVTAAASANEIDLFATSSWDSSSYLMQQAGYWNPATEGWIGGPQYVGVNGGFETVTAGDSAPDGHNPGDDVLGWVGWNLYGGQAWQADDTVEGSGYFGGSSAAKVWAGNPGDYSGAAVDIDVSKLNAGDVLTFSVDIYAPDTDGLGNNLGEAYAEINGFDADGNRFEGTNSSDRRADWSSIAGIQSLGGNLFSYTVTGDEARIEVNVGFAGNGNWGAMFIDNASLTLTQVPAPGALALLGLAAAGRRRRM